MTDPRVRTPIYVALGILVDSEIVRSYQLDTVRPWCLSTKTLSTETAYQQDLIKQFCVYYVAD